MKRRTILASVTTAMFMFGLGLFAYNQRKKLNKRKVKSVENGISGNLSDESGTDEYE